MMKCKDAVLDKIVEHKDNYFKMIGQFDDSHKDKFICAGFCGAPVNRRIGKVVQVRLESGAFGSDQVLIRCYDGVLQSHENNSYCFVPDEFLPEVIELFKNLPDEEDRTYTIGDKESETGFIIPSKVPEGESTPMREVKKSIYNSIENYINKTIDRTNENRCKS